MKSEIQNFVQNSSVSANYAKKTEIQDFVQNSSVSQNYVQNSSVSQNYVKNSSIFSEIWTFTLDDGETTVTKKIILGV